MNKYVLVFLMMTVVPVPVHAAWERLDANLEKGETHFFDPEIVRKDNHYRKVWVLSSYDAERAGGYRSVKTFYEFDCQQIKARSQTMLLYPDSKALGKVIGAHHEGAKEWFDFSSDSIFAQISDTICSE